MDNELVFHIGMPKTGSTALEKFLYENAEVLEHYGWCYPNLKNELPDIREYRLEKERNGDLFYNYVTEVNDTTQIFYENWKRLWEQVLKHLETQNVIISSEGLYEYAGEFWRDVKERYHRVKVIVYLRRQDRFIESYWNEWVKDINCLEKTFNEYVKNDNKIDWLDLHYIKKLDEISNVIGEDNLVVRVYEKAQFRGENHTLESDFLSSVGIKPDWKEFIPCNAVNLRLKGNYIEIKRLCNSAIAKAGCMETMENMCTVFARLSENYVKEEQEEGYFTLAERRDFLQQYLRENEEIAKKYLHRANGVLFYDSTMDYPVYARYQCNSFERDIIRVFSSMMCIYEDNLQVLKRQNSILVKKMLMSSAGERSLALFGAGYQCRKLIRDINLFPKIIIDNDNNKSGVIIEGVKVTHAKVVRNWKEYFVVITCAVTDEIEQQLQEIGLMKEKDYTLAKEYLIFSDYS